MANISKTIESFIISAMEGSDSLEISRNSLAEHFCCANSQINYVLDTRFTVDRGFAVESKRGSSGYVKIVRLKTKDENAYLSGLVNESIGEEISQKRLEQIFDKLVGDEILQPREAKLLLAALSDEALAMPFGLKERIRAQAAKNILINLMKK